jgi:alkanesulfonate monooxygenase SsuD/methylene tetrahydromethanopterin reductase-like flavin-dependent oxidoreductase (luciferase family)
METSEALAIAGMLDEAGYDGVICADHLIYPRDLTSPYPSPAGQPPWPPETAWPDSWT